MLNIFRLGSSNFKDESPTVKNSRKVLLEEDVPKDSSARNSPSGTPNRKTHNDSPKSSEMKTPTRANSENQLQTDPTVTFGPDAALANFSRRKKTISEYLAPLAGVFSSGGRGSMFENLSHRSTGTTGVGGKEMLEEERRRVRGKKLLLNRGISMNSPLK
jgi:hypothetical protein